MDKPRFQFQHEKFRKHVKDYYEGEIIDDMFVESCVRHISSGLPASTNQFIIICNEMDISPLNFLVENY